MTLVNKLKMLAINVSDMAKSKVFYEQILGLKVATDYRKDDDNWWVTLAFPQEGTTLTLARAAGFENLRPGMISIYLETSDVDVAYKELVQKRVKVDGVKDDLFGPGSGVRWISLKDPDGNEILLVQEHEESVPF